MTGSRLEAFSDGVLAIIITIMVLELRTPAGDSFASLAAQTPKLIAYIFSFIIIAIYWNNHHHLLRVATKISSKVMWANMHLLFWLSLIPLATAWVGEGSNYLARTPVGFYAFVGMAAGFAYYILSRTILLANPGGDLQQRIGGDKKGIISLFLYMAALVASYVMPVVALVILALTAVIWFIPDRRLV